MIKRQKLFISLLLLILTINLKAYSQNLDNKSYLYLKNLSNAINILKSDETFKNSLYLTVNNSLEPYFYLNFDSLIFYHYQTTKIDLGDRITKIIDSLSSDTMEISETYMKDMLLHFKSNKMFLNLTIPNYLHFDKEEINNLNPLILLDDESDSILYRCLNCGENINFNIHENPNTLTWLISSKIQTKSIINPPYSNYRYIVNCVANKNPDTQCDYCPTFMPSIGNLPQLNNNTNNWELGIRNRNTNSNHIAYGNNENDDCLIVTPNPATNPPVNSGSYAILKARTDVMDAFKIIRYDCGIPNNIFHSEKAVKLAFPIIDFQNSGNSNAYTQLEGNIMTLCENSINPFVNYTENDQNSGCGNTIYNWRFAAAYGFYEINRPTGGRNSLPPLYFCYPYSNGIWWGNSSPDMTVLFDHEQGITQCLNPKKENIANWYGVDGCSMCNSANLSLTFPNNSAKDYLVNDDPSTIINYWSTPKIQIGLKNGPNTLAYNNTGHVYEFGTTTNPYQCNNWNPTMLLSKFELLPGNEYEVLKPIDSIGTIYPPNTLFFFDITVNFQNNSSINRRECVTCPASVSCATVQLFSKIKDYDPNIINYEIKIYK